MRSKRNHPSRVRSDSLWVAEPLNEFPPNLPWEALLPAIGRANAALARYDAMLQGLPRPDILLAPLVDTARAFQDAYSDTPWAKKASVWAG